MMALTQTQKTVAYDKYFAGTKVIQGDRWNVSMETKTFDVGNKKFSVLPVATSNEVSVYLFGEQHPTKMQFPELTQVIQDLHLQSEFLSADDILGKVPKCFDFAWKTSAQVCEKVNGRTFFSVCPREGTWVWFVVTGALNKEAEKALNSMAHMKPSAKNRNEWYAKLY
jgi:hypothetical protein